MEEPRQPAGVYRFGSYEADVDNRQLRRDGLNVRLQGQPFEILALLLEHAGNLVTREQLRARLWSAGTVVEFDHSVHTAVTKLREALGDDADNPRFVATVPRHGYRFIGPVVGPVLAAPSSPGGPASGEPLDSAPRSATRSQWLRWPVAVPARLFLAIAVVFALGFAYLLIVNSWRSKYADAERSVTARAPATPIGTPAPPPSSDKAVAVLPFVDMSEKHDQEYFGDGMAEAILDLLVKIPGVAVIGRTSSFQFKGKNVDLRAIGAQLNAAYVLEGSVRNSGDRVRITAQLINTRTGRHEWSEMYDRHIGDVLKLQDAIAAAVARELQLTVAAYFVDTRSTPKSAEAYDLYLRGRHAYDRRDKEALDEAAALFQRALDRDPTFADAALWLAWTLEYQGELRFMPPAAAFEQARRGAVTALQLDPKCALAHTLLGAIHTIYDWDWAAAEREFQQAAALAPGSMDVLSERLLSLARGRWDDALKQTNAWLAQDPLNPARFRDLSAIQAIRGRLPEAEAAARRALDIRPTLAWGHYALGRALLARGDRDAALLEMQQETTDHGRQQGLAIVYAALGRKAESDAALATMLNEQADWNAMGIADVYAFRGQSDDVMHWLERAYVQKDPDLFRIKSQTELKSLEADPRFKAFLRKMNLPE